MIDWENPPEVFMDMPDVSRPVQVGDDEVAQCHLQIVKYGAFHAAQAVDSAGNAVHISAGFRSGASFQAGKSCIPLEANVRLRTAYLSNTGMDSQLDANVPLDDYMQKPRDARMNPFQRYFATSVLIRNMNEEGDENMKFIGDRYNDDSRASLSLLGRYGDLSLSIGLDGMACGIRFARSHSSHLTNYFELIEDELPPGPMGSMEELSPDKAPLVLERVLARIGIQQTGVIDVPSTVHNLYTHLGVPSDDYHFNDVLAMY